MSCSDQFGDVWRHVNLVTICQTQCITFFCKPSKGNKGKLNPKQEPGAACSDSSLFCKTANKTISALHKSEHLHKYLRHLDFRRVSPCIEWHDPNAKHNLHNSRSAARHNHRPRFQASFPHIQANSLAQSGRAHQSLALADIVGSLVWHQSTCKSRKKNGWTSNRKSLS